MDDEIVERIVNYATVAWCEPATSLRCLREALVRADVRGHLGDYPSEEQHERRNAAEQLLMSVAGEFFRRNEIEL